MTLRCKPGDLAVVIGSCSLHPDSDGVLVRVLERAPDAAVFRLPDGVPTYGGPDRWVIEFTRPLRIKLWSDAWRLAPFACCLDAKLRPIRDPGDDAVDEVLQRVPTPKNSEALA